MPTSVMPKGVEHTWPDDAAQACWHMPTSVMPKGVEHSDCPYYLVYQRPCPPL